MPPLITERLSADQVRLAFPLMRASVPDLSLGTWLRYARRVSAATGTPARGVLVARRPEQAHLCGVVCYRKMQDIGVGAVLVAEHFVALDLFRPHLVLAALTEALDRVAAELGCVAVRAVVDGHWPDLAEALRACGHVAEGTLMVRPLPGCAETRRRISSAKRASRPSRPPPPP